MADANPQFIADGNIKPMRFVKAQTTKDNRVLQAGSGDKPIGISQPQERNPPWSSLQDGYAAAQDETLRVFGLQEVCWLVCGGTVTAGDYLKPDTDGKGVTSSSDGDLYGAQALESGTTGQQIRVQVLLGMRGA